MQKAESGGRIKKQKQKVRKKLLNNLGLKLISVIFAVMIWFIVVISTNPKETRIFANIPVTLTNVELLEKENKVYEILDHSDSVRVTVEVPRSDLDKLRASDIVAEADMSKLTAVNTIAISYSVLNEDVTVTNITGNREFVKLNVEDKISKWVRIESNIQGEVAEGYMVSNVNLDLTSIQVMGPRSAVEQVRSVRVDFDVTDAVTNLTANVEPKLYDADGNLLDLPNVTTNAEHVLITVHVLATKEVPIEVASMGEPAEGYLATGVVECSLQTVKIAATPAVLANVNKISIPKEQLDLTDAEGDVERTLYLRNFLPTNVQLADSSVDKAVVKAYVEPVAERTLTIPAENIAIFGCPEGFQASVDKEADPCKIVISGLNAVISEVQPNGVFGTVDMEKWLEEEEITDLKKLKEGTYEIPVHFEFPENIGFEDEYDIKIKIEEVEEEEE